MEISKIPYPDLSLQSLPYSLNPDQLRERLITLDFRENDVFRFALGCEDEKSRKIRFAYLSALFHIQVVRADIKNTEPMKTYEREKGVRFDLLIEVEDDKGQILLANIEMQNYQMNTYTNPRIVKMQQILNGMTQEQLLDIAAYISAQ